MTIKTKDGVIVQADDGNPSEDCNCCGEEGCTTCPTTCTACATTLDVTLGSTGMCDGTFTLTRSGCEWHLDEPCPGYRIQLDCSDAAPPLLTWRVFLIRKSDNRTIPFTARPDPAVCCPPIGNYISGGVATCTVS